jgi:hypothetical protein
VVLALTSCVAFACVAPPKSKEAESAEVPSESRAAVAAAPKTPPPPDKLMVWDGDENSKGKSWADCSKKAAGCKSVVAPVEDAGRIGKGLKFEVKGPDWAGFGWNWHGFYPENAGTDITGFDSLSFWIRVEAKDKAKAPDPANFKVVLSGSGNDKKESNEVVISDYVEDLFDGEWHEVIIPLSEFKKDKGSAFDPRSAWEFRISTYASSPRDFTVFVDEIGFDHRKQEAWVSRPERRAPRKLEGEVVDVEVTVDLGARTKPINPLIYGVSFGDQEMLHEMGVTTRRVGGNENSPYDWKTGYTSLGHDWFFQNRKAPETPHPEQNRWAMAFPVDKKWGIESYLTLPAMGWVAKDATSFGFPRKVYPDQAEFAGDRPDAGNGKRVVKDKRGKPVMGEDGKPKTVDISIKPGESHNGKKVSVEEQTELLSYSIEKSGFGKAASGGIKYVCLDNEPMIWWTSHRDMIGSQMGYEDYWNHMLPYATRLKEIDPDVEIAGPALWGWTAYFYSAKDAHWVKYENGDKWDRDRLPEHGVKHQKTPFLKWWLAKAGEYKKQHAKALFDIVDVHVYPNMKTLERPKEEQTDDPRVMEFRIESIKSLWDPKWRTKDTWMGEETGGKLAILPMIKGWIDEGNPGMKFSVGEYEWSGWDGGYDISGAVAQVEVLRVFAEQGVDMAYYWANPRKNSPVFFAFKMLRNPDGKHTAIGDSYLPAKVSRPDDVQAFVTRSAKDEAKLSFVFLNKRVKKSARIKLKLSAPLPEQAVVPYELSGANPKAIGELPARKVGGSSIEVELPPMSVLRFDAKSG